MNTPWGKSDHRIKLAEGISWYGTPSHGGFGLTERFANSHLSQSAIQRGERKGGYLWYEEDVDYAIVVWELFGFHKNRVLGLQVVEGESKYTLVDGLGKFEREALLKVLSSYRADYLQEIGVTPDPAGLQRFNDWKLHDKLRADKSPDLIVSAVGDWHRLCPKGQVLVTTASDEQWLIPEADYQSRGAVVLNLLSSFPTSKYAGRNGD